MPGPTWPNRLFAHAGSSGGLDNSLSGLDTANAVVYPGLHMRFDHPHVYDALVSKGKTWRVYHGDTYPQVLCLEGMVAKRDQFFRPIEFLRQDLDANDTADYTFIEPYYDPFFDFYFGNSQHPVGSVSAGETLIAYVHNAIFQSKPGATSALLVTWDEHGGFFDQVRPPATPPPNDAPLNYRRAANPGDCAFNTYGVRVPAMLVSPWLRTGLSSTIFPGKTFDHASIVSSLREVFGLGGKLTDRDGDASTWWSAGVSKPRQIAQLPARSRAIPRMHRSVPDPMRIPVSGTPSGTTMGILQIAVDIDWHVAERTGKAPLIASTFQERVPLASQVVADQLRRAPAAISKDSTKKAHRTLLEYLAAVKARDVQYEKSRATMPKRRRRTSTKRSKGKARK
jgi:phospholipase C